MKRYKQFSWVLLAAMAIAAPAYAQLVVTKGFMRPSMNPAEAPGTYIAFIMIDKPKADDVLVSIKGPAATIDLVEMKGNDASHFYSVANMPLQSLMQYSSEGTLTLRLRGVSKPYKAGDKFPLTFVYKKSGEKVVELKVAAANRTKPTAPTAVSPAEKKK